MPAIAFVVLIAAAPIPPQKLALLPRIWPDERIALQRRLEQGEPLEKLLKEREVDPRVLELIGKTALGPLLNERYAHRLVYLVPGLTSNLPTSGVVSVNLDCEDWLLYDRPPTELALHDYPKKPH